MKRKISVFIASPGDLSTERSLFRNAIHQLNVGFGDGANVEFEPLGWEDTFASTGRRSQSVINEEINRCDVFILVMHRRWGQEAPDAKPYSSYTEEEFYLALERWKKNDVPEIFVFFKRVDATSEADPGPQLKRVMDFRKQLEETRQVLYHYFEDDQSFVDEVDRHLRAYARGDLPKTDKQRDIVVLPSTAVEEIEKAKAIAIQKASEAKAARDAEKEAYLKIQTMQFQMAEDAANLSREGKIEYARQKFAELVVETFDIRVLYLGYEFYSRTGDLDSALSVLKRWLTLSGPDEISILTANAYCNLGDIYKTRGELKDAEEMYQKSLAISEALDNKGGMACCYGGLGMLYRVRGELEYAEEMYKKSLVIEEFLGREVGMASDYGNLGVLYQSRGELEFAEEMYQKSLAIFVNLKNEMGMANGYGNLGSLYQDQGRLDEAELMYQKSLNIEEGLGRKEGMASDYGNLGNLYQACGDFERAEEMYKKSLTIEEALGRKEGIASDYGNLGVLYGAKGELERAEDMLKKSLAIEEALGRKAGIANCCFNLGMVAQAHGQFEYAKEMYLKAIFLFNELKSPMAQQAAEKLKNLQSKASRD
jgi:tetratricopeptide (TPR) repeat protein